MTKFDSDFRRLFLNLDLNTLTENPLDLLSLHTNSQANQINKSILTFLSKNFICFNFSNTDFLILSIISNLIKETNIAQQQYAADLFSISCKYLVNNKIKSFYQIEKADNFNAENNNNNSNNLTNQSCKINNINSSNTSMLNALNSPSKGGQLNNDYNNNNIKNANKIFKCADSKLPYFISLLLGIINNFLQNQSSGNKANLNFSKLNKLKNNNNNNNNDKSNIINSLKSSLAANLFANNNNNNINEFCKFNPMEGEVFELVHNLIEKAFYFMQEILLKTSEKDILAKLLKHNSPDFTENDFNDKLFKFFVKAEIIALNDFINFIHKILFYNKTEKTLKNRIIYFFFENLEKILLGNQANQADNNSISNNKDFNHINIANVKSFEEIFSKNLFIKDENLLISLLVLITESLSEQFNSKAEEYFSNLPYVLVLSKVFFSYLNKNKDNVIKISQFVYKVNFFVDKGNKLVLALEDNIKQKRLIDESINKIIQEEKSKNA